MDITWIIKQLLPLKYESTYRTVDEKDKPVKMHSTWRMWFGQPFNIVHEVID